MAAKTHTPGLLRATSPRKELFEGIQTVGKAVATRSSLPILTHVRIAAKDGKLSMMATDLEMWMEHTLPGIGITEDGSATAPARNFTELLAALPDADVSLTVEDETNTLHLRCMKANYKLLGLSADEFPLLPQVKEDSRFVMDRETLRDAIKQTIFATSTDETRAILTGVLVVFQGDSLKLVATDTHRLAVRDCPVKEGSGSASAIVPSRAMNELLRIIGNDEGEVVVTLSGNQIQFQIENGKTEGKGDDRGDSGSKTTLISRLIDGQFPNYERVIPAQATKTLTVERAPLAAAVKRASIVAREGDASPVEIAFNAKYLADVLNVLDTEGLHIELTEPLRPGVIRPTDDADYLCVLMPMQVV